MAVTDRDLPRSVLFDSFTQAQQRELLNLMEPSTWPAGTVLLEEGQQTRGLWVITRGRCEVSASTAGGTARVLAELGPGAIVGEMTFFQPGPHSATVRSLTDAATLKLSYEAYVELERSGSTAVLRIAHAVAAVLSERLRRMDDWTSRLLVEATPGRKEEWSDFRAKLYSDWAF